MLQKPASGVKQSARLEIVPQQKQRFALNAAADSNGNIAVTLHS
jgi:hypothetical protein